MVKDARTGVETSPSKVLEGEEELDLLMKAALIKDLKWFNIFLILLLSRFVWKLNTQSHEIKNI